MRRPWGVRANRAMRLIKDMVRGYPAVGHETLTQLCQGSLHSRATMDALTIHEAAETTGWSPRMLRYVERVGLVEPARSASGYRLYGPADTASASRLRRDPALADAVEGWLEAEAERPHDVPVANWLRFEQEKHQRLLAAAAATAP